MCFLEFRLFFFSPVPNFFFYRPFFALSLSLSFPGKTLYSVLFFFSIFFCVHFLPSKYCSFTNILPRYNESRVSLSIKRHVMILDGKSTQLLMPNMVNINIYHSFLVNVNFYQFISSLTGSSRSPPI